MDDTKQQEGIKMGLESIFAIISLVTTVISTGIAGYAISYSRKLRNIDMSQEQYNDLKDWYKDTLSVMKDLYTKHLTNTHNAEKLDDLSQLSTQISLGRLFFENQDKDKVHLEKPSIYRGKRVLILDLLILYYDIFDRNIQSCNDDVLRSTQRAFESEMTELLKSNRYSPTFIPYTTIDPNNIVNIDNISNPNFRDILTNKDIVKAIKNNITIQPAKIKKSTKPTSVTFDQLYNQFHQQNEQDVKTEVDTEDTL